mgnify:CR=1 FL=1
MVPNFLQPPQITFTFSTNHLAANIIQHRPSAPDYGMPPWDLLTPSAALCGDATWCMSYPSNIPPKGALLSEQMDGQLTVDNLIPDFWKHFSILYL